MGMNNGLISFSNLHTRTFIYWNLIPVVLGNIIGGALFLGESVFLHVADYVSLISQALCGGCCITFRWKRNTICISIHIILTVMIRM
jgi:hypothetical protein